MNLIVTEDVFNADDLTLRLLDQIIDRVEDGVHRIEIKGADRLKESDFYLKARPGRQRFLLGAASRIPTHRASRRTHLGDVVIDSPAAVIEARKIAYTPLTLLVEDREADGVLIEIIINKLASPEMRELWDFAFKATPAGIEITTAGGVNAMPQRISRILSEANINKALRLIVICDSDNRWPLDPKNLSQNSIDEIKNLCVSSNIRFHVLKKRTAENYIPDEVFIAASKFHGNLSHKPRFLALLERTALQRDHFPVKDGMSDAERESVVEAGFYSAAEIAHLDLLKERLFPKRPRLMLTVHREYLDTITAAGLRARDGSGEFDDIMNLFSIEL